MLELLLHVFPRRGVRVWFGALHAKALKSSAEEHQGSAARKTRASTAASSRSQGTRRCWQAVLLCRSPTRPSRWLFLREQKEQGAGQFLVQEEQDAPAASKESRWACTWAIRAESGGAAGRELGGAVRGARSRQTQGRAAVLGQGVASAVLADHREKTPSDHCCARTDHSVAAQRGITTVRCALTLGSRPGGCRGRGELTPSSCHAAWRSPGGCRA